MSGAPATERLSKERILDAAMALAQAEGVGALSMRRIAAELNTGAMSLYNHVPDKQALLDGLVERMLGGVELPDGAAPREICDVWAQTLRRTLLANSPLVPLLFAPRELSPMQMLGRDLTEALVGAGLGDEQAVAVVRVMGRYVAGSIMFDAGGPARLRARAPRKALDQTFDLGLHALLDGLTPLLELPSA